MFAHLHSSPLVMRKANSACDWRNLPRKCNNEPNPSAFAPATDGGATGTAITATAVHAAATGYNALEPVEIIDVKEERKLLLQCVRESKKRLLWHSEVADLHNFRKVLSYGCRALHFSGHGVPGRVIFENKKCEAHFVSQHNLKELFLAGAASTDTIGFGTGVGTSTDTGTGTGTGDTTCANGHCHESAPCPPVPAPAFVSTTSSWVAPRTSIKLVFVSACHSESVANAFVSVGVPHVIVVSKEQKVLDKKAMEFSKAFYTALFAGHSVAKAFEIGQVQADLCISSDVGNSRFKLLPCGANHDEALFQDVDEGHFIENSLPWTPNDCDAVAEAFVGRSIEIHQVYRALAEGARLVTIVGEKGVGKTEIALQCAQYASERRLFQHIFFFRLPVYTDQAAKAASHAAFEAPASARQDLWNRLARSFLLETTTLGGLDDLVDAIRAKCSSKAASLGASESVGFLLLVDGFQPRVPWTIWFRELVAKLLRRVHSLSFVVTSESRLGGMLDGVGERLVHVDRLSPTEAALLFSLRAPRKLRVHEMGRNFSTLASDLATLSDHPVVRALECHPRTICAVAQFLEKKDLELDQHEFLQYIIPSVQAGLSLDHFDAAFAMPACNSSTGGATVEDHQTTRPRGDASDGKKPSSSLYDLYVAKVADHMKRHMSSTTGALVWARAVVGCFEHVLEKQNNGFSNQTFHQMLVTREVSMDQALALRLSWFFASKLQEQAVKRPLSSRGVDFLSTSRLIWGDANTSPSTNHGMVRLDMFVAFWQWFEPLVDCIVLSELWSFTSPRLLHGFLSKEAAVHMLTNAPPGTFLVRFSETKFNTFVIAFVDHCRRIQFVPISWKAGKGWCVQIGPDSSSTTSVPGPSGNESENQGDEIAFGTFAQLIHSVNVLVFLFPNTPKHLAFRL